MSATNALNNTAKAVAASNATGVRFVTIELELGVVSCQMASTTNCERNAQQYMTRLAKPMTAPYITLRTLCSQKMNAKPSTKQEPAKRSAGRVCGHWT
jgi:hypothetical protein